MTTSWTRGRLDDGLKLDKSLEAGGCGWRRGDLGRLTGGSSSSVRMISSLPIWRARGGACGERGGGGEQLSSSSKSSARLAKKDLRDDHNEKYEHREINSSCQKNY